MRLQHALENAAASQRLGWVAGLAAWFAVLLPSVAIVARRGSGDPSDAAFLASLLLFGALFVLLAGPWQPRGVRRSPGPWVGAAIACACAAVLLAPQIGVAPILFILSTALTAHVAPARVAYGLVAFQTATTAYAASLGSSDSLVIAVQTVAIASFQLFTAMTTYAMLGERKLRQHLSAANAELRATRALLRETSRLGERVRISRELHDLAGHHLTALHLQLEVASHVAEGSAAEHVLRARSIAKLLLADVREVVTDLRRTEAVDVREVLGELVDGLPRPRVHLEVDPALALDDPERAHVVVRCVQEAVTNAIRHGDADNVWVTLRLDGGSVDVVTRDDGVGASDVEPGNGLRGMRERVDGLGGRLDVTTSPGAGFAVRALIPLARPAG
jgi:signal transduction histidine kinase